MFNCKYCDSATEKLVFVPFEYTQRTRASDPKWNFHIRSECEDCGKFQKFLSQTPELMQELKGRTLTKV